MGSRIIKESICTSGSIDRLTWFEEVLFYRLIVSADDFGRYDGRIAVVRGRLFPLKRTVTDAQIEKGLKALSAEGMIRVYVVGGQRFIQLEGWARHQQIRNKRSRFPDPSQDESGCDHLISDESICASHPIQSNPKQYESNPILYGGNDGADAPAREKKTMEVFKVPTVDEVRAYCVERKNAVDPEKFIAHYTSNGWHAGRVAMKNWKAAVITWEKNEREFSKQTVPARAGTAKVNGAQQYAQRQYDPAAFDGVFADLGEKGGKA